MHFAAFWLGDADWFVNSSIIFDALVARHKVTAFGEDTEHDSPVETYSPCENDEFSRYDIADQKHIIEDDVIVLPSVGTECATGSLALRQGADAAPCVSRDARNPHGAAVL